MAKLKFTPNPEFKKQVTIQTQDGPGEVGFTFKYRSRTEFSEWLASIRKKRTEGGEDAGEDSETILARLLEDTVQSLNTDSEIFMQMVTAWDFPDRELNLDTAKEFLNNYHGAGNAVYQAYCDALQRGILGNSGR